MSNESKRFTQVGRITSLFGVMLPPKKSRDKVKYITLQYVLEGIIPSKKNRQRAGSNLWALKAQIIRNKSIKNVLSALMYIQKNLKLYIYTGKEHEIWHGKAAASILAQHKVWCAKYERYGVTFGCKDCSLKVYHYFADNRKRDLSNKFESIADLFVDIKIIEDDSWQYLDTISSEGADYSGQINDHITVISLTVRIV